MQYSYTKVVSKFAEIAYRIVGNFCGVQIFVYFAGLFIHDNYQSEYTYTLYAIKI